MVSYTIPFAGVRELWTGMHKDYGRQIWDEPGKGPILALTGYVMTFYPNN
jgi:hypothetical protein